MPAATAATFILSVAFAAPFAAIWWHAQVSVWPYALGSTLLEAVYALALAYAYRTSDVSFIYPLTRGIAPVLVLAFAVAALGHHATGFEVGGVALIGLGVVLVRGLGKGDARSLVLVATIATSIAAYTLVDRAGIHRAGAFVYFVLVLAGPCLATPLLARWTEIRGELNTATIAAAGANVGSFVLGLLALRHAAAAPVLAVRSSSVVFATLLASRLLTEEVAWSRIAGSVLVFGGVVLLAL